MISFSLSGSTDRTQKFLQAMRPAPDMSTAMTALAQRGVAALQISTPTESGLTAASWGYEIDTSDGRVTIYWTNTHVESGVNIAVILQYGHGTGTGGFVSGRDYINPAIQPLFDEIANEVWKKVTNS